jgi:hypothetical protein
MASPFKFDSVREFRPMRLLAALAAATLSLGACKREILFDEPSSRLLTVYSELTPGMPAWVHATRSTELLGDDEPMPVADAVVRWMGEDGELLATATYQPDSARGAWYATPWAPTAGTTYRLEVEVPADDLLAAARVYVPTPATNVRVDSLFTVEPDPNDWFPLRRSTYEIAFVDDGTPGVFVLRALMHNRTGTVWPPADTNLQVVFSLNSTDPLWETNGGRFSRLGTARLALNEDLIPNGERLVRVEVAYGEFGDLGGFEVVFAVEKWDSDLYKAIVSQEKASGAGSFNPFVQPTTSFTNVAGGIGYAGGKSRVWVRKE